MPFDREMQRALEADGEKLRQLTGGEDHGPWKICPYDGEVCRWFGCNRHPEEDRCLAL